MQEVINYKWKQFLKETQEQDLQVYLATFVLTVNKQFADSSDIANLIRSIPNVTTVAKEAFGREDRSFFKAIYRIKFVLELTDDVNNYVNKILRKSLQNIDGLRVNSYKGTERIDTAR